MKQFDDIHLVNLNRMYDFLQAFVDYYEFDPKVAEDGEPTDAAMLEECLPSLKAVIESEDIPTIEPQQVYDNDYLYNAVKLARESVNPNYKYCVVYNDASECGLTDDIGVAMEHAAQVSKTRRLDNINVCRIVRSDNDGTYRTKIEGWCSDGHYYDKVHGDGDYLHFDFIAQRANVYKI